MIVEPGDVIVSNETLHIVYDNTDPVRFGAILREPQFSIRTESYTLGVGTECMVLCVYSGTITLVPSSHESMQCYVSHKLLGHFDMSARLRSLWESR